MGIRCSFFNFLCAALWCVDAWGVTSHGFATNYIPSEVHSFDPANPSAPGTLLLTIPGGATDGITVSPDGSTVYFASFTSGSEGDIFSFPVTGPYSPTVLGTGVHFPLGVAVSSDGTTGFITTDTFDPGIFTFPTGGSFPHTATSLTAVGAVINSPAFIAVTGTTAFVAQFQTGATQGLYTFPLTGSSQTTYNAVQVQTQGNIAGLALSSQYLYYSVSVSGEVYRVPIDNPAATPTLVAKNLPISATDGLTVSSDGNTVFVGSTSPTAGGVYSFPTNAGFPQIPTLTGINVNAIDVYIWPPPSSLIPLTGLTGNNLVFARYLNKNAPISTLQLFSSLTGSALKNALQNAAPTRNAFSIFAAENSLLLISERITDRIQRRRLRFRQQELGAMTALLASNSNKLPLLDKRTQRGTFWAEPLVEYYHVKGQDQCPAFTTWIAGPLVASDYCLDSQQNFCGGGIAYLYGSLKEHHNYGRGTINQGLATFYGNFSSGPFFLDAALWGSYYSVENKRNIFIIDATATSKPHGWQFMPHLEVGGYHKWGRFICEPFAMADWANNWASRLIEHGAPGFDVHQKGHYSAIIRSEIGSRFYEIVNFDWGDLTFIEKGSYVNQTPIHTGSVTAFIVGLPGSFTVSTFTRTINMGLVQLELYFEPSKDTLPKFAVSYEGQFGSNYLFQQLAVTIEKSF
jgi:sugar lactone lactonase YvrE